jgi:hypothetical protein
LRQAKNGAGAPSAAGAIKRKEGAASVLPQWLSSALGNAGKSAMEKANMPCLDKAFSRLQPLLPSLKRERLVHVQSGVMLCSARLLLGVVHMHTGNGALAACLTGEDGEEVVYTSCFCECKNSKMPETTLVPVLGSTELWKYPWVMLSKASYVGLMKRLSNPSKADGAKRQRRETTP